jgi:polysaccharide export outer membrane protein
MTFLRALWAALLVLPFLAATASAQSEYRVRSGDTLQLEVLEDASLNRDILVLPDGRVSVPFVGSVQARGRTLPQIQTSIRAALTPSFAEPPTVFVGLQSLFVPEPSDPIDPVTIAVYVIGEVETPGKREIESGTTLLQFLAEMGGFSQFAATKRIQLRTTRTGQEQVYTLNYNDIERGAGISIAAIMADGDVIVVPQRRLFE